MRVRRVRLLKEPEPRTLEAVLRAPRARRLHGTVDRVRVRSVWMRREDGDMQTRWGWNAQGAAEAEDAPARRAAPARPTAPPADDFLAGLRELLRPNVHAVLRREEWPHPLYPFQEEGVLFLYERDAALLADEMGLGKSVQALAAAGLLFSTGQIQEALILCPAALVSHWRREARRWLPRMADVVTVVQGSGMARHHQWHSRAPLRIAWYETFRSDFTAGRMPERHWDLVVLDEAQRIKNRETELAHACKALPRRRSWALTGTPLENSLDDVLSILEWVTRGSGVGLGSAPALRAAQEGLQLRRKKEAVALQLPPKTVINIVLDMGPRQRDAYERLQREGVVELRERGERLQVTHVLALLTRLKQLCNFCPATGESAKLEFLRGQLAEILAHNRQALVFSQFTDERAGLLRLEREIGPEFSVYHGGMSPAARDRAVQRFNDGDSPVLGLSLRAGGVGLNLQRAAFVFHFDRWWNPAVEWQAEDRAHRIGQPLPVTVYRLIMGGTVEEKVHGILEGKEALFREVIEGVPTPGRSGLSIDELFGVLDLEMPPRVRDDHLVPPDADSGFDGSPG